MEQFSDLKGKVLTSVENVKNLELIFTTVEGEKFKLWHRQDCCENVVIEDINGDLDDLTGSEILLAEESSSELGDALGNESETWTFYRLATAKGYVDIRWVGISNGYYSESVDFDKVD